MIIRDFTGQDKQTVLAMADVFYHSPAVSHPIPLSNFADVYDEMCDGGSARLRGLVFEAKGRAAGYASLSFGYSTEAGGPVVFIEEVYIAPEFRGQGIGAAFFTYLKGEYHGKAARLRLEVEPDNRRAAALYSRLGFETLPYNQMICEDF